MKILIAVPTFENITPDTFKSIWDLDKGDNECSFNFVRGYDCATARNKIAQLTLDGSYDYVFMIDNDVTPPKDALLNLLSHNVDVVSGFYMRRYLDDQTLNKTCVYKLKDEHNKLYFNYSKESAYTKEELIKLYNDNKYLIKIHGGGMGCILIKTSVFNKISYPWFDWVNYNNSHRGILSEDLFFCEQLRKNDIPCYVDTRVGCGHLIRKIETCKV